MKKKNQFPHSSYRQKRHARREIETVKGHLGNHQEAVVGKIY